MMSWGALVLEKEREEREREEKNKKDRDLFVQSSVLHLVTTL